MLEWQLKNFKKFKHLDTLIAQKERGLDVPFLDNVPEIEPLNQWIMSAFNALSSQRTTSDAGPQPIQISEIRAYAEFTGLTDEDERDDLLQVVLALDKLTLEHSDGERRRQEATAARKRAVANKRKRR